MGSAEHSTASCVDAETGLVLWKAVFSEGEAATREPLACREGLEFFKSKGIDVGAMVIDDSNCRVIIEATQRGQAATEAQRRQFIKVLLDVWHSKKNGKPEMEKYLNGDDSSALDRFLEGFVVARVRSNKNSNLYWGSTAKFPNGCARRGHSCTALPGHCGIHWASHHP